MTNINAIMPLAVCCHVPATARLYESTKVICWTLNAAKVSLVHQENFKVNWQYFKSLVYCSAIHEPQNVL